MSERDTETAPGSEREAPRDGSARSLTRLLVAGAVTVFAGLLAAALWAVSSAQYLGGYCTSRASQPTPANPESLGGRPAYMPNPVTVRCEYDGFPTVDVIDPMPLLGAVVMVGVVAVVATLMLRWGAVTRGDAVRS